MTKSRSAYALTSVALSGWVEIITCQSFPKSSQPNKKTTLGLWKHTCEPRDIIHIIKIKVESFKHRWNYPVQEIHPILVGMKPKQKPPYGLTIPLARGAIFSPWRLLSKSKRGGKLVRLQCRKRPEILQPWEVVQVAAWSKVLLHRQDLSRPECVWTEHWERVCLARLWLWKHKKAFKGNNVAPRCPGTICIPKRLLFIN